MMTTRLYTSLLLASLALGATAFTTRPADAASFDCKKSDLAADEKAICEDLSLNDLDVKMVTTFDLLAGLMPMGNRDVLREDQLAWLKTRQACDADTSCIRTAYETRMKELEEAYKGLIKPL
jgi:uncharacterized protein